MARGRIFSLGLILVVGLAAAFQPASLFPHQRNAFAVKLAINSAATGSEFEVKKEALKQCLKREYLSFFAPFEKEFYVPNVRFIDPLNSLEGADKYQGNVDMLGARTALGSFLFRDASINLHSIEDTGDRELLTRWTLKVCFKALPWQPVARFTGVSKYQLDADCLVVQQNDYWDSINLRDGQYREVSKLEGVLDFVGQLGEEATAASAMGAELPFELLRRAKGYEVRRYPAYRACFTPYETRPEGYDRLGSYAGGENESRERLKPLVPSLQTVSKDGENKIMEWPLQFLMPFEKSLAEKLFGLPGLHSIRSETNWLQYKPAPPAAGSERVGFKEVPSRTFAIKSFDSPTTADYVRYWDAELRKVLEADGLVASPEADTDFLLAQYDAIFSIAKRRNEVWIPLASHDWEGSC